MVYISQSYIHLPFLIVYEHYGDRHSVFSLVSTLMVFSTQFLICTLQASQLPLNFVPLNISALRYEVRFRVLFGFMPGMYWGGLSLILSVSLAWGWPSSFWGSEPRAAVSPAPASSALGRLCHLPLSDICDLSWHVSLFWPFPFSSIIKFRTWARSAIVREGQRSCFGTFPSKSGRTYEKELTQCSEILIYFPLYTSPGKPQGWREAGLKQDLGKLKT